MIKAILDINTIIKFAEFRVAMNPRQKSRRVFSDDFEVVGMIGEAAFAKAFNLPMDLRLLLSGDGGVDFITPIGTVDVKTFRKAFNLLVDENRMSADIYVLASYNDATKEAVLLGWEYGEVLKQCPIRDFGYGVRNHYKSASKLRKMSELSLLLKGEKKDGELSTNSHTNMAR